MILAFGEKKAWAVFLSAFLGYALGALNILPAYAGAMPLLITGIQAAAREYGKGALHPRG